MNNDTPFIRAYGGYLKGILAWDDLDRLWQTLRASAGATWYIYAVGETPPTEPADEATLLRFIEELDQLLRKEHRESYCGIVYVDDPATPRLIKVYDPNNLGSVCGSGFGPPPLPGWILTTLAPVALEVAFPPPAGRRRWWRRLFRVNA